MRWVSDLESIGKAGWTCTTMAQETNISYSRAVLAAVCSRLESACYLAMGTSSPLVIGSSSIAVHPFRHVSSDSSRTFRTVPMLLAFDYLLGYLVLPILLHFRPPGYMTSTAPMQADRTPRSVSRSPFASSRMAAKERWLSRTRPVRGALRISCSILYSDTLCGQIGQCRPIQLCPSLAFRWPMVWTST